MPDDQELLILYLAGELGPAEKRLLEDRLAADESLHGEMDALRMALEVASDFEPAEPPPEYWRGFWARLQPRLRKGGAWRALADFFSPRHGLRLAAGFGALAAMLAVALLVLYQVIVPDSEKPIIKTASVKIERTEGYFELATSDHLERSRLLLQEVVNIASNGPLLKEMLLDNRFRGEELLRENRTYRLAALRQNDKKLAGLLDELELVLMDIANIDPAVAHEALNSLQQRIERKDLLEKLAFVDQSGVHRLDPSSKEVM